ncbi:hypothetical protein ACP4OV_011863 [Aristida adscensionis]
MRWSLARSREMEAEEDDAAAGLGSRRARESLLLAWVLLWLGVSSRILLLMSSQQAVDKRREALATICDHRARLLQDHFNASMNHLQALAITVSTFHHSKKPSAIDQMTFARYAGMTAFQSPLTTGVAYAVQVTHAEREKFERQQGWSIKKMYFSNSMNQSWGSMDAEVREPAEEYAPVIFAQDAYKHVISIDMLSGVTVSSGNSSFTSEFRVMAGVLHLWNRWEIQILVLLSFALQVFLLMFAWMRRRRMPQAVNILLWLMYLLAEYTATYALGHLSIGSKPGGQQHQQLMAFWAPFLLVHLGGQDTITAYSMEDNQLWLRHLLSFTVQAMGAAYVLYKYIGSHGPLVVPWQPWAIGLWALSLSRLEMIRKFLDGVSIKQKEGPYTARTQLVEKKELDGESVLQGAHDLLYICMGQFVDDKIWPSEFQNDAIKPFHAKSRTFELIEMQLSLMSDIFYTKFSTSKDGYNSVDVAVTYILVTGASILGTISVLTAMGSTWTCATLKVWKWDWLHGLHVSLRRSARAAQTRRWSSSIGQINLLDSYTSNANSLWSNMNSLWRDGRSMVSMGTKKLVLEEISTLAEACNGREDVMRSYHGQCALKRPSGLLADLDLTWSTDLAFDQSILVWHLATDKFLRHSKVTNTGALVEAIKVLSNYMMFLLVEHPYMLPSPVRSTLHLKARQELQVWHEWFIRKYSNINDQAEDRPLLKLGEKIAHELLRKESNMAEPNLVELLRGVFGVWVEMMSYAAHHCSRESHAKQLNNGGEFITAVWLPTTAEFNRVYYNEGLFKVRKPGSFWNFLNFVDFKEFRRYILKAILRCITWPIGIIYVCVSCCCDKLLEKLLNCGGYLCFFCCLPSQYQCDPECRGFPVQQPRRIKWYRDLS